ncbi:MAG: phenylalanine--tRNA ligase subunit beta [Candidatus Aminicenantales bacterium]
MRISYDWLQDFIELKNSPAELVKLLNRLGLMVEKVEEVEGDFVFEVETYVNRPDTLGHLGIAREVAAALGEKLSLKSWPVREISTPTSTVLKIEVLDPKLCPRYCGAVVKGVKVGPSPSWLQRRLAAVGLRPINNVVDVTNYVLMATGHPIHAFDLNRLSGPRVVVRRAKKGETLRILGGQLIELNSDDLVIADEEKPVALAGIIGGEDSAVTESTRDVFIESACFNPVSVRRTRQEKGLDTDASYRFERGADISFPPEAARIAVSLLCEFGGKATQGVIDIYPEPFKPREVLLRLSRVRELLGMEVSPDFIQSLFASLGFEGQRPNQTVFLFQVPSFRVDIEREIDLIEEVARFYGYDCIPSVIPPIKVIEKAPNRQHAQIKKLRQVLFHQGFDEVLNFSFSDARREALCSSGKQSIGLSNPLSTRNALLRTSLMTGLLETVSRNQKRGAAGVHIFEIGNIYYWEDDSPAEKLFLGLATAGECGPPHWSGQSKRADFFHLKGTCELLLTELRYEPFSFHRAEQAIYENGYCLALEIKSDVVGFIGKIKPEILAAFEIEGEVWGAEINLALLLAKQPRPLSYVPVGRFPAIIRDISFVVSDEIPYEEIRRSLDNLNLPYLESMELVDRFTSSQLGAGKVSLTLRFTYRHPNRTLLAEEVDRLDSRVINHLRSAFQARLREGGKD